MAEALRKVHMHKRGYFESDGRPVDPKLVINQIAALVPEIMDVCSSINNE
jgi:hypothetical protein